MGSIKYTLRKSVSIVRKYEQTEKAVIVLGYGKTANNAMLGYMACALSVVQEELPSMVIYSGGDTTDISNGNWKTAAEMMSVIAKDWIGWPRLLRQKLKIPTLSLIGILFKKWYCDIHDPLTFLNLYHVYSNEHSITVIREEGAYNTITNITNSLKYLEDKNIKRIVIVCNLAHAIKVMFASIRLLGLTKTKRRVVLRVFPLTVRVSENVKTLIKTVFETFGYFYRPFGRYLEYWQWKIRTGRNEQLSYWQFRLKFRGELL